MMKGMAIIEHLIGFLMQDFKKKIDMSFIDEDKKRKIVSTTTKNKKVRGFYGFTGFRKKWVYN